MNCDIVFCVMENGEPDSLCGVTSRQEPACGWNHPQTGIKYTYGLPWEKKSAILNHKTERYLYYVVSKSYNIIINVSLIKIHYGTKDRTILPNLDNQISIRMHFKYSNNFSNIFVFDSKFSGWAFICEIIEVFHRP